jgi:RND superfamily putative drug exporter
VLGRGAGTPLQVVAELRDGDLDARDNRAAVARLERALAADRGVERVRGPLPSEDRRSVLLLAEVDVDAESAAARRTLERLRDTLPGAARGLDVAVGGTTGTMTDFRNLIAGSMWKILLFVLGLSYVVLLVLLRSVVLPLKAVAMNLLSVGAAYGVLVMVFQWGWLEWAGIEQTGYLDAITPPLILAVVFGLSMDYEVFLLSRIRERYDASGDTRRAVAEGLATSARTITSAALIMVAVFLVFVSTGLPSIQQLGLGNAVAIAVDATLVRLVLVPAAMELLGRWNWWLPRPLARVLPQASFEELGPSGGVLAAPAGADGEQEGDDAEHDEERRGRAVV